MPIPPKHNSRHIYHFTHLDNLPGLLKNGFLSVNEQKGQGVNHRSIASRNIQERRATTKVTCGPRGVVHDYVPLYLCKRTSMLLRVVNSKNCDQPLLIHFAFPIELIEKKDVVFTSAAANTGIPPTFYEDPNDLEHLTWGEIDSLSWKSATESLGQAKMAEVLVHRQLQLTEASHIVVWNEDIKKHVKKEFNDAGLKPPKIQCDAHHYYTKFAEGKPRESLVKGPIMIRRKFDEAKEALNALGNASDPSFVNLQELRDTLDEGLDCTDATQELIGLKSNNLMHQDKTVEEHTLTVVRELRELDEFEELESDADRLLVEIAAYLHDVGKGPKARWVKHDGVQQVDPDHPVLGLPYVVKILTDDVETVSADEATIILKLVCYHDLVGDILGRGRHQEQLFDIIESKGELDMLFALGRADINSLNEGWWDENAAGKLYKSAVKEVTGRKKRKTKKSLKKKPKKKK